MVLIVVVETCIYAHDYLFTTSACSGNAGNDYAGIITVIIDKIHDNPFLGFPSLNCVFTK